MNTYIYSHTPNSKTQACAWNAYIAGEKFVIDLCPSFGVKPSSEGVQATKLPLIGDPDVSIFKYSGCSERFLASYIYITSANIATTHVFCS